MLIKSLVLEYLTKARAKVQRTWLPGKKAGVHYYLTAKNTKVYGKPGPGDKIAKPEDAAKKPAAKKPATKVAAKNSSPSPTNTPASSAKKPPQPKAKPVTTTKDAPSVVNEVVDLYGKISNRDVTREQVEKVVEKIKATKDKQVLRDIGEKIRMEFGKSDSAAKMADKISRRLLDVKDAAIKSTILNRPDKTDNPNTPKPAVIDNNAKAQPFTDRIAKGERLEEDEYADYANILSNMEGADVMKHLEAIRGGSTPPASKKKAADKLKEAKQLTPQELDTAVVQEFDSLLRNKFASTELVPIHEIRSAIAEKHGKENATNDVFNEAILNMRRNKQLRLVSISDRSKATPQQLQDSVHAVGETFFYAGKGDKYGK